MHSYFVLLLQVDVHLVVLGVLWQFQPYLSFVFLWQYPCMLSPYFHVLLFFPALISISVKSFALGFKTCILFHLRKILSFSWMSGWTVLELGGDFSWRLALPLYCCSFPLFSSFRHNLALNQQQLSLPSGIQIVFHVLLHYLLLCNKGKMLTILKICQLFCVCVIGLWDTYLSIHMFQDMLGSRSGIGPAVVQLCSRSKAMVPEAIVERKVFFPLVLEHL